MATGEAAVWARTELLNVLGDVKARVQDKLGIVDFPMPQFILIGKQSVGKSRLIEALAGESFNFISGTLGSRRPTVLEFRNVSTLTQSRWYVRDLVKTEWKQHDIAEVMKIVGEAHESLGESVSADPLYVRVESAGCVDVQIVDLPGFRDFAVDDKKKALAQDIENLVLTFMNDTRNTMLCVEQSGDSSTYSTLNRCKAVDPEFKRTVLIRNKLDKQYRDLNADNVNQWVDGYGDLPASLDKFALSLPFWGDGVAAPASLIELREKQNKNDRTTLSEMGIEPSKLSKIGFQAFADFMQNKVQALFVKALKPVMDELDSLRKANSSKEQSLSEAYRETDPSKLEQTTRDCAHSFSQALTDHMRGQIAGDTGRISLEDELRQFHQYHAAVGASTAPLQLPTEDFRDLNDYIDYLLKEADAGIRANTPLSGGAQWRRLLTEVDLFLRFSEIGATTKKTDVIQARGIAMTSLTWRDVVVKLLSNEAQKPLKQRVGYVGERLRWFFMHQKEATLAYMCGIAGNPMDKSHSSFMVKHGMMIKNSVVMKQMLWDTYDKACLRQMRSFLKCFEDIMTSQFSNPWVFLKGATAGSAIDGKLPANPADRIPIEMQQRAGVDDLVSKWLQGIPTEPDKIDTAVDKVQQLVLKTYSFIRSQVCDQVELMAELFFKMPMLRRLDEDMAAIELSPGDKAQYAARRSRLEEDKKVATDALVEIDWCMTRLSDFQRKVQASSPAGF